MRLSLSHHSTATRAAVMASGIGALMGWSTGSDFGLGLGIGLAATTATLLTTGRHRPVSAGAETDPSASFDEGWDEVQRELDRCRRHARPFVLIRIPCTPDGGADTVAEPLRRLLRSIDRLWVADGDLYLLLPETSRAMGEALIARVRRVSPELLQGREQMVAFPEDAVTGGALRAMLNGHSVARYSVPFTPDLDLTAEMG